MTNRRDFLKWTGFFIASLPLTSSLFSQNASAADLEPVKETDPAAKSLGFCKDTNKPLDQCKDRKAADKKDQFCKGCQLFTATPGKDTGKCVVFPNKTVPANGWCKSWVKKPA